MESHKENWKKYIKHKIVKKIIEESHKENWKSIFITPIFYYNLESHKENWKFFMPKYSVKTSIGNLIKRIESKTPNFSYFPNTNTTGIS